MEEELIEAMACEMCKGILKTKFKFGSWSSLLSREKLSLSPMREYSLEKILDL